MVPNQSVDMVLADLPYGTTACKWDSVIPFEPLWEQLHRVTKPNAPIVLFGSEPFSSRLRLSNIKRFKYDWVWKKESGTGFARSKYQPLRITENVSVFNCSGYFPQMKALDKPYRHVLPVNKSKSDNVAGSGLDMDGRRIEKTYTHSFPTTLLEYSRDRKKIHPTQKPVALLEYLIKTYTLEGDTVLDPTMGSGSTGVACANLNRKFIGIEKDEKYYRIAVERLKEAGLILI